VSAQEVDLSSARSEHPRVLEPVDLRSDAEQLELLLEGVLPLFADDLDQYALAATTIRLRPL
jgi:hypothetical protein